MIKLAQFLEYSLKRFLRMLSLGCISQKKTGVFLLAQHEKTMVFLLVYWGCKINYLILMD